MYPERQLILLKKLKEMTHRLSLFRSVIVYDDNKGYTIDSIEYLRELVDRDIPRPFVKKYKNGRTMLFRYCPKCNTLVDHYASEEINFCKCCGQALYDNDNSCT